MCPNHVYHDLAYLVYDEEGYEHRRRIRSIKRPRLVDIEILPNEEDEEAHLRELTHQGEKYRVSENGVKLSFIEKVKRYVALFVPSPSSGKSLIYAVTVSKRKPRRQPPRNTLLTRRSGSTT